MMLRDERTLIDPLHFSTPSTRLDDCTTRTASSKNGGPILRAMVSTRFRNALLISIRVSFLNIPTSPSTEVFHAGYTVDDGKGGKVHVNVSMPCFV